MRTSPHQHVGALDHELPVEPVADDPVRYAFAALDRVQLEVRLHEVPVTLVTGPGVGHERRLTGAEYLRVRIVAVALVVAARRISVGIAVATRCRATLGHAGEVHADLALIDVRAVLQLQGRNPAVLVVVLDVRREMREREPGVDVVFVRQKQELVRMIRAPRADPIGAVFHPVAQVDRLGLLEEMPGRSAPRGGLATDQEVHLQGAASGNLLRRSCSHPGVVVPSSQGEGGVLEPLLHEHRR